VTNRLSVTRLADSVSSQSRNDCRQTQPWCCMFAKIHCRVRIDSRAWTHHQPLQTYYVGSMRLRSNRIDEERSNFVIVHDKLSYCDAPS